MTDAIAFLLVFLAWLWSAFIHPATFNRWNAKRFVKALEASMERGSPTELVIVANELSRSAEKIIKHATNTPTTEPGKTGELESLANHLLYTMGSQKFCWATIDGAPKLINNLFCAISRQSKYRVGIEIFTKNIISAAIENRDSFLYRETDYYDSGQEGLTKPITSVLCQDPKIVNNISTLLSPNYSRRSPWDIEQWQAYFRLVLCTFSSHIRSNTNTQPAALHWSKQIIILIFTDLNEDLQLTRLSIYDDLYLRLKAIGDLIKDMVSCLNDCESKGLPVPEHAPHYIVDLIRSLIKAASSVRRPRNVAIRIQHELIWTEILNSSEFRTNIGLGILQKVHDWLEATIRKCPNLDSIRLLGYCLNVLGFHPVEEGQPYGATWRELHVRILDWTQANIATLLMRYPRMERECFVEGMSYDRERCRLVLKYSPDEQGSIPIEYFDVQPHCETDPTTC